MPNYSYRNPNTGEEIELFQTVHENHTYTTEGVIWERIWFVPNVAFDTKVDAFNERKFLDKTNKILPLGELWDRGKEMSQIRAEKNGGVDPIATKHQKEKEAKELAAKKARMAAKTKGKKK